MDPHGIITHLQSWMRNYALKEEKGGFVVGVSGGVDSAVCSTIAARTKLPVLCLDMPIHQDPAEAERAHDHCIRLTRDHPLVEHLVLDLTGHYDQFIARMGPRKGADEQLALAAVNTKSRLRLAALYYHATARNFLVLGTGNRVEQRGVGFFAKYGDGGMDLAPLTDLLKSEMYRLAEALEIDPRIIQAQPTDGLWPDRRTDLEQIGATYPELEWAMDLREGGADTGSMELDPRQQEVLRIYDTRHADNRHKRLDPPEGPIPRSLRR